jgi:FkbM family methyltransferase
MKNLVRKLLFFLLIRMLKINPESILYFAYYTNNIRPGHNLRMNGELFLIQKIGRHFDKERLTVFDVGANNGEYSRLISAELPNASIYAFEPNYELAKESNYGAAKIFTVGLGQNRRSANLFFDPAVTEEASIHENVSSLASAENGHYRTLEISIETLDDFCKNENIEEIDFLKIDTEGNEYAVLLGAKEMLQQNKVSVIQFEFNEMNVISRVFLKDFYGLISNNFNFYRLQKNALMPLGHYKSHNEIFVWHNLVAVNKKIERKFLQA